jgi:16S rRNA (guanine527-N7)-methyltransferase
MELTSLLRNGAENYDIKLSDYQVEQFMNYMRLLKEWNEKINLTAITDEAEIIKKHFIDSIAIMKSDLISTGCTVIDVGTGAGFPGIPINIIEPGVKVLLLDSLNKRVNFLNEVIKELKLTNIEAVHGRAEEMSKNVKYREKFDIATARAVANMNVLSEYCMPYVKKGGHFIALKGPTGYEEVNNAKGAINILGGKITNIIETKIIDEEYKHNIVIIKKIKETSTKYPRRYAIIEKTPLK